LHVVRGFGSESDPVNDNVENVVFEGVEGCIDASSKDPED
jgi:hypothetical protein